MLRRPRPGEDDLDQMMKEFEKDSKPAASACVSKRKSPDPQSQQSKKTKSLFAKRRQDSCGATKEVPTTQLSISVLSDIKEKEVNFSDFLPPQITTNTAFPEILKLSSAREPNVSKKSLFSQQFMKMKQNISDPQAQPNISGLGERSFILEGSGLMSKDDVLDLHTDNIHKLESLPEEEILKEQEKLLQSLDPKVVQFLVNRRYGDTVVAAPKISVDDVNMYNSHSENKTNLDAEKNKTDISSDTPGQVDENDVMEVNSGTGIGGIVDDDLGDFPNMDKNEPEKRQWMTDVPEVDICGSSQEGFSARFGFDGSLLDPTVQMDVQSGLYHHGEEPGRAGYTLSELFILLRSSNSRQRIFALDTLAAVIDKYWTGVMDFCFSVNPVVELVAAGLFSMLRSCLDEREESVVFAATQCLANLIAPQGEESALDLTALYTDEAPSLAPVISSPEQEEEEELKDHELVQVDAVLGLLRMDILPRLRYILTVLKPGPGVVLSSLRILIRISRHSLDAAQQISNCPGLLQAILFNFLPPLIPHTFSTSSLYGAPVWLACKLCRTLCAWDVNIARLITTTFDLPRSLIVYMTVDPAETVLPSRESALLCIESYRTWCTLLRFNLLTDVFTTLYPVLMKQLLFLVERVEVVPAGPNSQFNLDVGSWLIRSLTTILGSAESVLTWDHVADLRRPLETCCRKWLVQLSRSENPVHTSEANIIASALNFLSVFYIKIKARTEFKIDIFKADITGDFTTICCAFIQSSYFKKIGEKIEPFSGYTSTLIEPHRALIGLPMVGAVLEGGAVHPVLNPSSPIHFISSFFRFISVIRSFEVDLVPSDIILSPLSAYLSKLTMNSTSLAANWFSRFESRMLFWGLSTQFKTSLSEDLHRLSTKVCGLLQKPDEILLKELMEKIVFNETVLQSEYLLSKCLDILSLDSVLPLSSPSNLPQQNVNEILKSSLDNVEEIKATYFNKLLSERFCAASTAFHNVINKNLASLVVTGETILAQDWQYFPLLQVYNLEQSGKDVGTVKISDMRNCLAWLLITENEKLSPSQVTAKYYRLATVFLSGNDLFLDPVVHNLLAALLRGLTTSGLPDLSISIPGLTSGHEFYLQLLDQFQAVSYGDQLFSMFVTIPLSMSQPVAFRRSFWTDKPELSRSITLQKGHFGKDLLETFTKPVETDINIIASCFSSLMRGNLVSVRNGFLYDVAVSHLKNILHLESETKEIKSFQRHVSSTIKQGQLKCDLEL